MTGYHTEQGHYADVDPAHLATGTLTANKTGEAVPTGDRGIARLTLDITAASGTTPTLDVTIETSEDKTTWTSVGTFTQATAAGKQRKVFVGLDRYVRAVETVGGTGPSFTRTISGELV